MVNLNDYLKYNPTNIARDPDGHICYISWTITLAHTRVYHREGGPARIWEDGTEWWYYMGNIHRLDGPAIIEYEENKDSPDKIWYIDGKRINASSQEEFEKFLRLKAFW